MAYGNLNARHVYVNRAAGVIRSYGGLTFLRVLESGHMVRTTAIYIESRRRFIQSVPSFYLQVPLDQPQAALEMLNAFTGSDLQAMQSWEVRHLDGLCMYMHTAQTPTKTQNHTNIGRHPRGQGREHPRARRRDSGGCGGRRLLFLHLFYSSGCCGREW